MKADIEGLLLGACVGDALGLPAEGLSPDRIRQRWHGVWKMRLVLGRGLISDDTEHAVMVALSLLRHSDDAKAFQHDLARRLRWWFAALPPGTGMATAKACIKLWLGFGPQRSGVFSAGNGPAMRSTILGAYFAHDEQHRRDYVRASTWLTHIDPKAEVAALAIAEAAAWQVNQEPQDDLLQTLFSLSQDEPWQTAMRHLQEGLVNNESVEAYVHRLGLRRGVSGYAYHTVPVALYGWLRHRADYRTGLTALLDCGGDTDTVGAIAGSLLGLSNGSAAIPHEWMDRVADWPVSVARLRALAGCFHRGDPSRFRAYHWLFIPLRNLVMLLIVLAHGFRRLV